jgi:hypothetical protein
MDQEWGNQESGERRGFIPDVPLARVSKRAENYTPLTFYDDWWAESLLC